MAIRHRVLLSLRIHRGRLVAACVTSLLMCSVADVFAALDLRNATILELENGLGVVLLEDRNFPVVSVQALYSVGARNETAGKTGLAHFLEHMAFRDSENFPDTELVSAIYAKGGEWHGYTWLDQTTYYSTVPKEQLDLLLRIEADRMSRLEISPDDMDAERGAVLTEMHMYENSPSSMLIDAVMFTTFLAHPYRNNTIGWESDIQNLEHADVVDFYRRHYHPANAVLVIVGDFDADQAAKNVETLFGGLPKKNRTPPPHTVEPLQKGEREIRLYAESSARQFMIGYQAPSVHSPDYAAFLVLQELLGAGSGVNFLQNDWGTLVEHGDLLHGAALNVTTWYPPSEQPFIFVIGGTAPDGTSEDAVVQSIDDRIAELRQLPVDEDAVALAIDDVLADLDFDIATTEDAAHQLAFFAGMQATDVLQSMPQRVAAVTAEDVHRAAGFYLAPQRRTIAWHLPRPASATTSIPASGLALNRSFQAIAEHPVDRIPLPSPVTASLSAGIPVIVQASDLSPTVTLSVVLPGRNFVNADATDDSPILNHSSITSRAPARSVGSLIARTKKDLVSAKRNEPRDELQSSDPWAQLEHEFANIMRADASRPAGPVAPALIVVSGDIDSGGNLKMLEEAFGDAQPGVLPVRKAPEFNPGELTVSIGMPVAQAHLGYIAPAPGPSGGDAYRILLYILAHDYEGRFGKAAISNRGLAYYIDSQYRSDGVNGWVTMSVGVDPGKINALRELMRQELARLKSDPPSIAEIEEAKSNFIGRARSSAQSNDEIASRLATEWLWYGDIVTPKALEHRLAGISRKDIINAIDGFIRGTTITVAE